VRLYAEPPAKAASTLAAAISVVFSPFAYLTLYLAAAVGRGGRGMALPALFLWAGLGLVPALAIFWAVRRGVWSDIELSRLPERRRLLALTTAAYAAVAWGASSLALPGPLRFAAVAFLIATLGVTAVTLAWKISLHTSCAGSILGLALLQFGTGAGVAAAVIAVALAWSRLRLERHDGLQVAAGAALGLATTLGLAVVWPAGASSLALP
jgi:hypothetical protein